MNCSLAILVISCDRYQDVWDPFVQLLFKFWPNCPYKIYLGTNEQDYHDKRVSVLKVGKDVSWSDGVRRMIEQIDEGYLLTFVEDFLVAESIESALIANAMSLVEKEGIACFRLQSLTMPKMPRSRRFHDQSEVFRILPQDEYCINAGIAIWRRETLLQLLKPGYSAWDFEVENSLQCRADGRLPGVFVTVNRPLLVIRQAVIQGKWLPSTMRFCRRHGVVLEMSRRKVMSKTEILWQYSKHLGRRILPRKLRRALKMVLFMLGQGSRFASPY